MVAGQRWDAHLVGVRRGFVARLGGCVGGRGCCVWGVPGEGLDGGGCERPARMDVRGGGGGRAGVGAGSAWCDGFSTKQAHVKDLIKTMAI